MDPESPWFESGEFELSVSFVPRVEVKRRVNIPTYRKSAGFEIMRTLAFGQTEGRPVGKGKNVD